MTMTPACRITLLRRCLRSKSTFVAASPKSFDPSNRPNATVHPQTKNLIDKGFNLPRSKMKVSNPPEEIIDTLQHLLQTEFIEVQTRLESHISAGQELFKFYVNRALPFSGTLGSITKKQIEELSFHKYSKALNEAPNYLHSENLMNQIDKDVAKEIKKRSNRWKFVEYDSEAAWAYLLGGKAAYDYACIKFIMNEIKRRDKLFQPKTLLDFGSGVGTVTWVVKEVFGDLYEMFHVDKSREMNDLFRSLINRSKEDFELPAGYTHRLQLPRDASVKYDLVTSSFTLLDLSSEPERLAYIQTLWDRVEPNGYLVLTEVGTKSGFQTILEARSLLNHLFKDTTGHIFAPCPHEMVCPRQMEQKQPCYFEVRYRNFPYKRLPNRLNDKVFTGRFSYLVAKKCQSDKQSQKPRVIEQPLKRHNHVVCRLCTQNGRLDEIIGVKGDKYLYKYLRSLKYGQQANLRLTSSSDNKNEEV